MLNIRRIISSLKGPRPSIDPDSQAAGDRAWERELNWYPEYYDRLLGPRKPASGVRLKIGQGETCRNTYSTTGIGCVSASNGLNEGEKKEVIATGQFGWGLHRIEKETVVRKETAAGHSKGLRDFRLSGGPDRRKPQP
jgi:hypothetical protein